MNESQSAIACETCDKPINLEGARLCNNCWEVEARIDEYIQSENGRNKLLTLLFADHLRRTVPAHSEAYREGYYLYPHTVYDLPYKIGSPEYIQFNQGWRDAAKGK